MNLSRNIMSALLLAGTLLLPTSVFAAPIKVNGNLVNNQSIMKNGKIMIPLRGTLEQLDIKIYYNEEKRAAVISKGNTTIELPVGRSYAYLNGKQVKLDTTTVVINGNTYIPLRFIIQAFGYKVEYDKKTGGASIVDPIVRKSLVTEIKPEKDNVEKQTILINGLKYDNTYYLQNEKMTWLLDGKYKVLNISNACADGENFSQGIEVSGIKDEKTGTIFLGSTPVLYPSEGIQTYKINVANIKVLEIKGAGLNAKVLNPTVE